MLCIGNQESKFFFWDLQKLEEGWDPAEEKSTKRKPGRKPKAGINSEALDRLGGLKHSDSLGSGDAPGAETRMSRACNVNTRVKR